MLATPGMVIAANDRFRVVWEARLTGGSWPIPEMLSGQSRLLGELARAEWYALFALQELGGWASTETVRAPEIDRACIADD
jgi:hypothetical protein